jgi:hypothetical protein
MGRATARHPAPTTPGISHEHDAQSVARLPLGPPSSDLLIRRNLHALPGPVDMLAYLRKPAQHLASFVAVERPRKVKIRPPVRSH